ncbi:hypothetical protein IKQ21_07410, partial [bacterium]|nr:hypothetical protein [bacterium]
DIIAKFWKSINTDRSVKSIASLDSKEIDALNKKLGMEAIVLKYTQELKAPNFAGINDTQWKAYVSNALQKAITEHGGIDSFKDEKELEDFINQHIEAAKYEATVKCVRDAVVENELKKDAFKNYGFNKDKLPSDLQSQIDEFINGILPTRSDLAPDELAKLVGDGVQGIINNYLNVDNFNELNKAKLIKDTLAPKLTTEVENDSEAQEMLAKLGDNYSSQLSNAINNFLNNYVTASNYSDLKTNAPSLLSEFKKSEFYTNMEKEYRKANAAAEVTALLTPTEIQASQTYSDYVTVKFVGYINIGSRYTDNTERFRTKNENYARTLLKEVLGNRYNETDANKYIEEAKATGLDFKEIPDTKKIVTYVLQKFGIDMDSTYKNEEGDSQLLQALVSAGVNRELAIKILSLTQEKRSAISGYQDALDAITTDYAEGTIKDKSALVTKLAEKIKSLVDSGAFQALQDEIDATTVDTSKKSEVLEKCINVTHQTARLSFRILDDGTIEFVKWSRSNGGVFNKEKDETVQGYFDTVKNALESTYSKNIVNLNLNDTEKSNLWNMALFITLSDTTTVASMYKEMNLKDVVNKLVDNYIKLLQKIMSNDSARTYITNSNSVSLLAGRTLGVDSKNLLGTDKGMTKEMSDYYDNNTTNVGATKEKANGDDWVGKSIGKAGNYKYSADESIKGEILYWYTGDSGDQASDDAAVNNGLNGILDDYIKNYRAYLSPEEIIKCFKEAEQIAFRKLNDTTDKANPGDTQIYGYSESGSTSNADYDTWSGKYLSVQAILLEVMYEMERKLNQKILGN